MPLRVQLDEDRMIVRLSGEIDHHSAQYLREEIDQRAAQARPKWLVMDFKGVEFMDSSGIGLVLGRFRLMQELGGELAITNMPPHLRKVMRVAGIENLQITIKGGEGE